MAKEIRINALYQHSPGQTWSGMWKHPQSRGVEYTKLAYWTELAQLCERGLIDAVFFADGIGVMDTYQGSPGALFRTASMAPCHEPTSLISAMAHVTENLAFAATGNTTYEHPFVVARRYSTLDHLTDGRVAWNVVTGGNVSGALAVGQPGLRDHDLRYDVADEFMEAAYKLWEGSWEDDAVVCDRERRIYADPDKIHRIVHRGEFIQMDGFHMCSPSPQRTPVIYQAGGSPRGQRFAAKHGECLFLLGHQKEQVARQVKAIRQLAVDEGRRPEDIKMILAATLIVAPTDHEAEELRREIERTVDLEGILGMWSTFLGEDLSQFELDEPLSEIKIRQGADVSKAFRGIIELVTRSDPDNPPTLRDFGRLTNTPGKEVVLAGSPQTVAQELISWVDETDVDGFNLARTIEPLQLEAFVDLVVPELQNRGRYKTQYAAGTFREKLFGNGPHLPTRHVGATFSAAGRSAAASLAGSK